MPEKNPERVKQGRRSKRKGASGEREAAAELQKQFPKADFHRGRQYHGGPGTPDVCSSIDGMHLEIKRTESLSLYKAMQQARDDAKTAVPVVMHRRSREKWLVVVELERLPELIRVLGPFMKDGESEQEPSEQN